MTERQFSDRFAAFDENYPAVLERIARAAERSSRKPEDVTLLAATKTVPAEVINHAVERGVACVGENRVQELLDKVDHLDRRRCDLQFIGRLQTNKVKYLMGLVSCIQSVDSLKLAGEISRLCQRDGRGMEILVEVNIGGEASKGGVAPEALLEFIDQVRELPGLAVRGLMAIPPAEADERALAKYFSSMRQYFVDIGSKRMDNVTMDRLSMGMSSDFPLAVEHGATMVRVGSALFGKREPAARRPGV